jgi:solute carrier family 35 protein F5
MIFSKRIFSGLIILHVAQRETFELPNSRQWEFLIINGLIGTVVSELLWLWGCFLTSSLVGALTNLIAIILGPGGAFNTKIMFIMLPSFS